MLKSAAVRARGAIRKAQSWQGAAGVALATGGVWDMFGRGWAALLLAAFLLIGAAR